jgi:hypothetical protein
MVSSQLLDTGDIDTLSVEEIIDGKIADAARIVEGNAPFDLLDSGRAFGDNIGWQSRKGVGMGWIHLPDDFMRLVVFQMSDWAYAVTSPITADDPLYAQQHSRYGIKGNPQRPVVAIVQQPIGLVLEFFTCEAGDSAYIKQARYIPIPKIRNGNIELCEKLKPAIIYYTAYLVAMSTGQGELAESLLNISNELMK